jgi:hypothetical protein
MRKLLAIAGFIGCSLFLSTTARGDGDYCISQLNTCRELGWAGCYGNQTCEVYVEVGCWNQYSSCTEPVIEPEGPPQN